MKKKKLHKDISQKEHDAEMLRIIDEIFEKYDDVFRALAQRPKGEEEE